MLWRVAVLWVAAGRALVPGAVWHMYTHGLTARPVGLGSGASGWAVAPGGSLARVGSEGGSEWPGRFFALGLPAVLLPLWCRFGVGGFNFPVASGGLCGRAVAGGGGWGLYLVLPVPQLAPPLGEGGCSVGCVVAAVFWPVWFQGF